MGFIEPKSICQIALVVKNLEESARRYSELFGVPVPSVNTVGPFSKARTRYRGQPTDTRSRLVVFDLGQVVLELTEADSQPSSWKEFLDTSGEGVHHIGFMVKNRAEVMKHFEKLGIPERHYGEYPGGSYTFVDSADQFGVIFNIKEEKD
jgi:catechol 2,3-dioxygenase-like lactoylglutathione lyase family enzyme